MRFAVVLLAACGGGSPPTCPLAETTGCASIHFVERPATSLGSTTRSLTVALLDGDSIPDVAIAGTDGSVRILTGNGDGTFTEKTTLVVSNSFGSLAAIASGDLDDDGHTDLAVLLSFGSDSLFIYHNKGDATFSAPTTLPVASNGVSSIAIADLNGDNALDVIATAQGFIGPAGTGGDGQIVVLLNKGDGTFDRGVTSMFGFEIAITVGDLDGDRLPDLAIVDAGSMPITGHLPGSAGVLINTGNGTFAPKATPIAAGPLFTSIAIADVNQDCIADLVTTQADATISVFAGNGDGTFEAPTAVAFADDPILVAVRDFDGDGAPDYVLRANDNLELFHSDGALLSSVPLVANDALFADVDGDGLPDLVRIHDTTLDVRLAKCDP